MRALVTLALFFISVQMNAQDEEALVETTIENFFNAFHRQDSVGIKKTVSDDIVLQTIAKDNEGAPVVKTQPFNEFLKSIISIPKSTQFEEVITNFHIQIDGPMANAWTDYEFNLDGSFHHCGVNSFQLVKDAKKGWQIIYLIDTRRVEGCK
ncbi:nuclear transport factor 2 family protein [Euzebyella marina]|uniref:Nuclear transport factor 2 family protein n=1 Tax=Euzebyella marina TaxID=1761453 RepID=A0A3G2L6P2_9FLAO|nr:nuclear transport factor 2 family protein [Euzebyella marina]AYN67934.1 nuclear transport factor 2 family protein [Euzebyella marina]